ncbi:hypothetical protein [Vibrio sp. HN007]|uniref:hypothetical protein n=1 Tax=Vibrio iocasae TaxID=3098914 RepID=UPI0035D50F1F
MAINPNEKLKARNALYCAGTGGGKTTALHQADELGLIPLNEDVLIFDTYSTFDRLGKRRVYTANSARQLISNLSKLRNQPKPFVASFVGKRTQSEFDFFQKVAWEFADGNRPLHIINEELIRFVNSIAKAEGQLAENYQGGRKFGLVNHALFQRGQEVPKTVLRGSQIKWIGRQDDVDDVEYWTKKMGLTVEDIAQLEDLEYYIKRAKLGQLSRGVLRPIGS